MAISETLTRDQCLYIAKLAHQADRNKDTTKYMHNLVTSWVSPTSELTEEERDLLFKAYKDVIGSLRSAWLQVPSVEHNSEGNSAASARFVQEYRANIETEVSKVCAEILTLVDGSLVRWASSSESRVFYFTMTGDFQRYLAEFKVGDDRKKITGLAAQSYRLAERIAVNDLRPAHPVRLGLALNHSVLYHDILNESESACFLAREAFSDALSDIKSLPEELYKKSTILMQQLQENLTRWKYPL